MFENGRVLIFVGGGGTQGMERGLMCFGTFEDVLF